ncbi:hypothetical protein [Sulfobacillus thermosulfidooxidans]|uniref:hypothetical protein n=1 Tax=Sulfobacillus thermosulfidooxidans TaxID=28034 RepID=UPI001A9A2DC0|nr:hypothetical protein [Sulfobacillus thermosulfidooxidans]
MKRNQGLTARLDGNYQIIAGQSPQYLGHLSGYGSLDAGEPPASNRVQLEWVIQASPHSTVALTVSTPKAGQVTVPVVLE